MTFDARAACASVTWLAADGSIDLERNRAWHERLAGQGQDGVLIFGTTGEFPSFTVEERRAAIRALVPRCPLPVLVGCGATALGDTLALVAEAGRSGAAAVLVPPPFYFTAPPEQGVQRFLEDVLNASEVPVVLYHIPALTRVPIPPSLVRALSGHPRLLGVKDSTGQPESLAAFRAGAPPAFRVWTGSDRLLARARDLGAWGTLSAAPNAVPAAARASAGDLPASAQVGSVLDALDRAGVPSRVAAWKWLAARRLPGADPRMRPPLLAVDPETATRLERCLAETGG